MILGSRLLSRQGYFFAAAIFSLLLFSGLWLIGVSPPHELVSSVKPFSGERPQKSKSQPKLHLLLPTNSRDIAWNEVFDQGHLLGAGSHIAKISKVLDYLRNMPKEADEELVMMMDAFDIWFQLKPEVLISRYLQMNEAADRRISERLGKAANIENIKQKIVFGAGKRCAPNQVHTIACYPVPESPVPHDIYGGNTDTIMGRNKYTSLRQRFLNSGYIIGPVKDLRKMFESAWEMVQKWPNPDPNDNGSHRSDFMYHGSDQSVFNVMFGQQEFQREVMRRRHSSWYNQGTNVKTGPVNRIEGTVIGDDILNPPFTHEMMEHSGDQRYEFGIGLDYFSEIGHQTANADFDGRFVMYNQSLEDLKDQINDGRNDFDCAYRGDGLVPADILASGIVQDAEAVDSGVLPDAGWKELPLYTNLCVAQVPVMIHHNGDKGARENAWPQVWFQPYAQKILEASQSRGKQFGAHTDSEGFLGWDDLCPAEYSSELFRKHEVS